MNIKQHITVIVIICSLIYLPLEILAEQNKVGMRALCLVSSGPRQKYYPYFWWENKEHIRWIVKRANNAGINVLMPCVYSQGRYFFNPTRPLFTKGVFSKKIGYDPLRELIAVARQSGLRVIPYLPCMTAGQKECLEYCSTGGKIPHTEWFSKELSGNSTMGNCRIFELSNPEVRAYIKSLAIDLAQNYQIDGILLDYIRYPGPEWGYSDYACQAFQRKFHINPVDLRLHPEKIQALNIFILQPAAWHNKPWLKNGVIIALKNASATYKFIEENPEKIRALPPNSILVCASCYDFSSKIIGEFDDYLSRGGNIVFLDGPTTALAKNKTMGAILGVTKGSRFFPNKEMSLVIKAKHPVTDNMSFVPIRCARNAVTRNAVTDAKVLADFNDGCPAVLVNKYKNGTVVLFNFMMGWKYEGASGYAMFKNALSWLSKKSTVTVYTYLDQKSAGKFPWILSYTHNFYSSAAINPVFIKSVTDLQRCTLSDNVSKQIMVLTTFFDPGLSLINFINEFVKKGGNLIVFMDVDTNIKCINGAKLLQKYPKLSAIMGLTPQSSSFQQTKNKHGHYYAQLTVKNKAGEIIRKRNKQQGTFFGQLLTQPTTAKAIASFSNGLPAVFINHFGKGTVITFNFGLKSTGPGPIKLFQSVVNGLAFRQGLSCEQGTLNRYLHQWDQWRRDQVTKLVKEIHECLKSEKPNCLLGIAAVDSKQPEKLVFQDWKQWLCNGYIDLVYPMNYFRDTTQLDAMLNWQLQGVSPNKICSLLTLYRRVEKGKNKTILPVTGKQLSEQIRLHQRKGLQNLGFFCDIYMSDELVNVLSKYAPQKPKTDKH